MLAATALAAGDKPGALIHQRLATAGTEAGALLPVQHAAGIGKTGRHRCRPLAGGLAQFNHRLIGCHRLDAGKPGQLVGAVNAHS